MSSLVERLYPLPDYRRTPLSLLRWWERRRLFYNVVVGAAGVVTLTGFTLLSLLPPGAEEIRIQWFVAPVFVYGAMANVCYSLGWLIELLARWAWGEEAPDLGPFLFREGLILSVALTLFPLLPASVFWLVRLATAITG